MPAYDEVAEAYSRTLDPDGAGLVDPVLTELAGDVAGQDVLSLACGQGQDARLLARLGATVTGIDISGEMLGHARRIEAADPRGIGYVEGDVQDLAPFADAIFDGVVCHMALMDVPDLASTIRSVARVLREPGWFVFSIVHPCYHPHVEIVSDYLLDHRYRKVVPVDWLPPHAYHRPLGAYVEGLTQAGLGLERVVEVHTPGRPSDVGGVPGLLYARAGRNAPLRTPSARELAERPVPRNTGGPSDRSLSRSQHLSHRPRTIRGLVGPLPPLARS